MRNPFSHLLLCATLICLPVMVAYSDTKSDSPSMAQPVASAPAPQQPCTTPPPPHQICPLALATFVLPTGANNTNPDIELNTIIVTLGSALDLNAKDQDLDPGNVTIKLNNSPQVSGRLLTPSLIVFDGREVSIKFPPGLILQAADLSRLVEVCFRTLHFRDGTVSNNLCASGKILSEGDSEGVKAAMDQALKVLNDTPKTTEEKNIFASGFAAKGEGNESEGGAEIHLNSPDLGIPGLIASVHLNKTTAENADPKNFEAELTYRYTHLFSASQLRSIKTLTDKINNPSTSDADRKAAFAERQRLLNKNEPLSGALLIDVGGKFEGEAFNFHVTNFVIDVMSQYQSPTYTLFGSRKGFWKFRLIGPSIEAGKNVGKMEGATPMMTPDEAAALKEVDYVARFKAGGVLTFFYKDAEGKFPFKQITGDFRVVTRYLFRSEVMFDETTMMDVMTTKGHRPWFQGDLRFYLADTPNGRLGFKVSYNRGSLPPVFANTKSFQFGLVYESADKTRATK